MTATPKTTSTKTPRASAKDGSAGAALPFSWSAVEYVPKKRWWWFVGLTLVAAWLSLLALATEEWFVLAVIVVAAIALIVSYGRKPRTIDYALTKTTLKVGPMMWRLEEFKTIAVEMIPLRDGSTVEVLVLIPSRRFRRAQDVYLPGDVETAESIIDRFATLLPVTADVSRPLIDRIARWLRLG